MNTIDRLKDLEKSAMRDPDLLAVDAITEDAVQEVFASLGKLLAMFDACKISRDECHTACQSWDNSSDCDCGYVARCNALEALGDK